MTARRGGAAFERDKRLLRDEGVPIELTPGDKGGTRYRIDKQRYELPDLGLSEAEAEALALAVATINLGTTAGSNALAKLDTTEPGRGTDRHARCERGSPSALRCSDGAGLRHVLVSRGDAHGRSVRAVAPRRLLVPDRARPHSDAQRTYRLDRFDGADITVGEPATFELPAGFDPSAALPADPKLLGDDEVVVAEIHVDRARASAVVTELGSDSVDARATTTVP